MNVAGGYCTFLVNDLCFGVHVVGVQEVLANQTCVPVPLAPAAVAGLANLRGQIVLAVDLRCRLGLPPRAPASPSASVVLHTELGVVSLVVDSVGSVVDTGESELELPPETLSAEVRRLVPAVCTFPDFILHLLDAEEAVRC